MILDYTALDVETTGLNPKRDKLIEVGAVRVRNGEITARFESLIQPGIALSEHVSELTGITNEMLLGAPAVEVVVKELCAFLGEDLLLGHSVLFDYSFVKRAAVNEGIWSRNHLGRGIDTLKIARKYLPELPSRQLSYLTAYYHIPHHAHRALADAEVTVSLYQMLARQFPDNPETETIPLKFAVKKESPITSAQKERLYHLIELHKIEIEYNIEMLTRNEASRLIDKIYLKYGRDVP